MIYKPRTRREQKYSYLTRGPCAMINSFDVNIFYMFFSDSFRIHIDDRMELK